MDWKIEFLDIAKLNNLFGSLIYFSIVGVIYKIGAYWSIILYLNGNLVSCLLMNSLVLLFFDDFSFLDIAFFNRLLICVYLL